MAQALVKYLQAQYSERDGRTRRLVPAIFGIFGHGNVCGVGAALEEEAGRGLPFYQPKNEQAMVHSAIGYARASSLLSTLACTASIGPGSTNMVTGAATATVNRVPVLLLPSDTFANRRQGVVMQALEHHSQADLTVNDCLRPVSRFFDRISRPEQLLTALPEAMRVLLAPAETGAVTLALHQDVQAEAYDYPAAFFAARTWEVARQPPPATQWRSLLGGDRRAGGARGALRHPGRRDLGRQGRAAAWRAGTRWARPFRHSRSQRPRERGRHRPVYRHANDRSGYGLSHALPGSRRAVRRAERVRR
jgi:3D-(3,5/4)-trihydroxycyclohexane-1,2-dione acylhydrolase (decyclizing)